MYLSDLSSRLQFAIDFPARKFAGKLDRLLDFSTRRIRIERIRGERICVLLRELFRVLEERIFLSFREHEAKSRGQTRVLLTASRWNTLYTRVYVEKNYKKKKKT